jgi:hypothetical protein
MFDTASDDISNEDVVLIIEVEVIDVVNKLFFSAVLSEGLFICSVIGFVLVSEPVLLVSILSVVISSVFDVTDETVNKFSESLAVVTA